MCSYCTLKHDWGGHSYTTWTLISTWWGSRKKMRNKILQQYDVLFTAICDIHVWYGMCVLAWGTLYLNNMSVYCTYIHTTYDFCMDNCGWRIWFLSQFWLSIWVWKHRKHVKTDHPERSNPSYSAWWSLPTVPEQDTSSNKCAILWKL